MPVDDCTEWIAFSRRTNRADQLREYNETEPNTIALLTLVIRLQSGTSCLLTVKFYEVLVYKHFYYLSVNLFH